MNKEKAKLLITAYETWEHDNHWRTAIIIAVVGSVALFLSPANLNNQQTKRNQQPQIQGTSKPNYAPAPPPMKGNIIQATPPPPTKLKPQESVDDITIEKVDSKFGKL